MKKNKILVAAALAIMVAPAVLNSLPVNIVDAAVGTTSISTPVYDASGRKTGRALSAGTKWQLGQQAILNGVVNYKVGTNEYIPASYVININGSANPEDDSKSYVDYLTTDADSGKTINTDRILNIVDVYGNYTGRTLPTHTQWKIGKILHVNKEIYYQVATNEFISEEHATIIGGSNNSNQTSVTETGSYGKKAAVGTTSALTPVYDASGRRTSRALSAGTKWQLGQQVILNGVANYKVGTNEYIPASYVTNVTGSANPEDDSHSYVDYLTENGDSGKTISANRVLNIVDVYGNNTGRTLPAHTQWKIGKVLHVNKQVYYQVATNEFISEEDATIIGESNNSNQGNVTQDGNFGKTATVLTAQPLVNNNGNSIGITLPANSRWKLGEHMTRAGVGYYQVATNEWIKVSGIKINNIVVNGSHITTSNGLIATLTRNQQVYDSSTNSYGQTLSAGTPWKIGHLCVNKYGVYWGQVSTNQWVRIAYTKLNSGLNLKSNSYYEPEFAASINK